MTAQKQLSSYKQDCYRTSCAKRLWCYQIMQNHNYQPFENRKVWKVHGTYKGVLSTYNSSISTCNMCMSYIAMWNFKTHHVACSDWVFGLSLLQLPPLTLQCISVLNESWACPTSCYYNHSGFFVQAADCLARGSKWERDREDVALPEGSDRLRTFVATLYRLWLVSRWFPRKF